MIHGTNTPGGWSYVVWWDRQGDPRGGSHTGILAGRATGRRNSSSWPRASWRPGRSGSSPEGAAERLYCPAGASPAPSATRRPPPATPGGALLAPVRPSGPTSPAAYTRSGAPSVSPRAKRCAPASRRRREPQPGRQGDLTQCGQGVRGASCRVLVRWPACARWRRHEVPPPPPRLSPPLRIARARGARAAQALAAGLERPPGCPRRRWRRPARRAMNAPPTPSSAAALAKLLHPAPVRDLYTGPLPRRPWLRRLAALGHRQRPARRAPARRRDRAYDVRLPSREAERDAWGRARGRPALGAGLAGLVQIHAGYDYARAIQSGLALGPSIVGAVMMPHWGPSGAGSCSGAAARGGRREHS